MIYYGDTKPRVYLETTVISYLVGRPSSDATLASWQQITRQLWEHYTDRFTFVVSPIVLVEVSQGNPEAAQRRLEVLSHLTILEVLPEADILTQKLLDTGVVPQNYSLDAQHIAVATTHGVEYLVSWNQKQMKEEDFENYTDPILEECYRIKEKLSAQFNSVEELSAYMRKIQEECRQKGMKVVSYYVPPEKREEKKEVDGDETSNNTPSQ